jgi:hypothetical protein
VLARETRLREVLGRRARPHRDINRLRATLAQPLIGLADAVRELFRKRGSQDGLAYAPPTLAKLGEVAGVETGENLFDRRDQTVLGEEVLIGPGRDREAVGDLDAVGGQLAVHLAERCVLPADARNIGEFDVLEPSDVGGHRLSQGARPRREFRRCSNRPRSRWSVRTSDRPAKLQVQCPAAGPGASGDYSVWPTLLDPSDSPCLSGG